MDLHSSLGSSLESSSQMESLCRQYWHRTAQGPIPPTSHPPPASDLPATSDHPPQGEGVREKPVSREEGRDDVSALSDGSVGGGSVGSSVGAGELRRLMHGLQAEEEKRRLNLRLQTLAVELALAMEEEEEGEAGERGVQAIRREMDDARHRVAEIEGQMAA